MNHAASMTVHDLRRTGSRSTVRALFPLLLAAAMAAVLSGCATSGRTREGFLADKARARELYYEEHRIMDALPLLEKLAAEDPEDREVTVMLAASLLTSSAGAAEGSAERRNILLRCRALAEKARNAGSTDIMVDLILKNVSMDGAMNQTFSANAAAEAAMKQGEALYARSEWRKALEAYAAAENLDPSMYWAPLFIGDCHYLLKETEAAGKAFARAIALEPDRETAYRYWGDALMDAGRMEEALPLFAEAVVAEPYGRQSWNGITQWAARANKQIGQYKIDVPVTVSPGKKTEISIREGLDEKTKALWLVYALQRSTWSGGLFAKKYPAEKEYRRSLAEECDAIRVMIKVEKELEANGSNKPEELDRSIRLLMEMDRAGALEPYVLLAVADEGIRKDYAAYRSMNRDALRRYVTEWTVHEK